MKFFILLLLLNFSAFAQTDKSIVLIKPAIQNTIYSNIPNPIFIVVPGAKNFTVNAPGLTKIDDFGNYTILTNVVPEITVVIRAEMFDGSLLKEEKKFIVKSLPSLTGVIDGENCKYCKYEMTKEELLNAEVTVILPGISFIEPFKCTQFTVKIYNPDETEEKQITVSGNKISNEVLNKIRSGSVLVLSNLKCKINIGTDIRWKSPSPIVITIN